MDHLHRAYSFLSEKSIADGDAVISGIATTPTPDRADDIIEPGGVVFRTRDIKLHLYHNTRMPVGHVSFGKPTSKGIPFQASLPDVIEEGIVRDRVNEARHSLKYNLLSAVSIGFLPMDGGVEVMKNGGYRFTSWEMVELSLTSVPMNPEAIVNITKSIADGIPMSRDIVRLIRRYEMSARDGAIPLVKGSKETRRPSGAVRLISR